MTLPLDHLVIAVHDLDRAIDDYTALGFQVLRGGEHPGRPTHNALVVFADGSYFELIAWRAASPGERWWEQLQRHGEGLVDFALLPDDAAAVVARAGAQGLPLDGPLDGGRLRPDGERLRWQIVRPPSQDLPFLCGDLTPRALRVPEGAARVHPNGALGVASVAVAVRDLDASLARWRALLGQAEGQPGAVGEAVAVPGAGTRVAVVQLGATALLLSAPRGAEGADGALARRLALRGEGPYALVLRTSDASPPAEALSIARTHGALIEFEPAAAAPAPAWRAPLLAGL